MDTTQPFTRDEAIAGGLTDAMLRSRRRCTRLFHGVYVMASVELTLLVWLRAAVRVMPVDAVVSHVTALRLYGYEIGPELPLHFSTRTATHSRQDNTLTHQRKGRVQSRLLHGIPVTMPDRTLIDIATKVTLVELVQAAEWMIHCGLTTLDSLGEFAMVMHLDGVRRMRRLLGLIREGVESPMETLVRLMIVFARLPEPVCNLNIRDAGGRFLARGDLVYAELLVLVEYDGWHHERDAGQRQRDLVRRERLEAAGWRVIVVTANDLKNKREIVLRVHRALVANGYTGGPPHFSVMWTQWFGTRAADPKMSAGMYGLR